MTLDDAITRQADQTNAAVAMQQALSHQPQLCKGLELLGTGFVGDVLVELWGKAHFVGSRFDEVDLEDVVLAGTTVSLATMIDAKKWNSLTIDADRSYEKSLGISA